MLVAPVRHGWSLHWPRADEHLAQQVGAVGDQPVDPEVEQLVHLAGLVDGPHVHRAGRRRARAHEAGAWPPGPPAAVGHLQRGPAAAARASGGPGQNCSAATSGGDAAVGDPAGRECLRNRRIRRGEKDPTHTRSWAGRGSSSRASGRTAAAALMSMLNRTRREPLEQRPPWSGSAPGRRSARPATSTSPASSSLPVRSVTRSSAASWKASSTPSRVACTSVSRCR